MEQLSNIDSTGQNLKKLCFTIVLGLCAAPFIVFIIIAIGMITHTI